jgi:hypothetical protein
MFPSYVVEVREQQVGLVVLERAGFRFFAATKEARAFEGEIYLTVGAATRAATELLSLPRLTSSDSVGDRRHAIDPAGDRWFLGGWFVQEDFYGSQAARSTNQLSSPGRSE